MYLHRPPSLKHLAACGVCNTRPILLRRAKDEQQRVRSGTHAAAVQPAHMQACKRALTLTSSTRYSSFGLLQGTETSQLWHEFVMCKNKRPQSLGTHFRL